MARIPRLVDTKLVKLARQDMLAERFKGLLHAEAWNQLRDRLIRDLIGDTGLVIS